MASSMGLSFSNREKWKLTEPKELLCEWNECNIMFDDLTKFLHHLSLHCNERISLSCDNENDNTLTCDWTGCGETHFSGDDEYRLHVSFHGFHQKLMSFGLMTMKQLESHFGVSQLSCSLDQTTRNILPELPREFVCGWNCCYADFHDAESFYRHVDTHAFDGIAIPSLSKEELKRTKFAVCSWVNCSASFTQRYHLKSHLRSHTQEKLMACPVCGAMFANRSKFVDHIFRQIQIDKNDPTNSVTLHLSKSNTDNNEEETVTTLTIQMPQQDETVTIETQSRSLLLQNLNGNNEVMLIDLANPMINSISTNNNNNNSDKCDIKPLKCPQCSHEFGTHSLLREHSRRHIHNYKCQYCSWIGCSPSALKAHVNYRHNPERPFACQFCESKFKSKSDLRRHIDTHSEEAPYKCSVCEFQSRCPHTVAKHHKEVHEEMRINYVCNECNRSFSRGNNLTRHLITIHKYILPDGQSRFQYQRGADGNYRLLMKTIISQT